MSSQAQWWCVAYSALWNCQRNREVTSNSSCVRPGESIIWKRYGLYCGHIDIVQWNNDSGCKPYQSNHNWTYSSIIRHLKMEAVRLSAARSDKARVLRIWLLKFIDVDERVWSTGLKIFVYVSRYWKSTERRKAVSRRVFINTALNILFGNGLFVTIIRNI